MDQRKFAAVVFSILLYASCAEGNEEEALESDREAEHAVLFPFFAVTIGIVAFWVITR